MVCLELKYLRFDFVPMKIGGFRGVVPGPGVGAEGSGDIVEAGPVAGLPRGRLGGEFDSRNAHHDGGLELLQVLVDHL